MPRVRAHVYISGYVQGVNFRASTRREAVTHGVTGWVANVSDGRVEAILEGEASDVQRVIDWCHQGPPRAHVEKVEVNWEPYAGEFDGFDVEIGPYW